MLFQTTRFRLLVAAFLLSGHWLPASPLYSVTQIPGLPGSNNSHVSAINNSGQVIGYSYLPSSSGPSYPHSFLYSNGVTTDLGTLGGLYPVGNGINNRGQVTGTMGREGGNSHAFVYSNGMITDLGTLGGSGSYGYSINDSGQVTGYSNVVSPGGDQHAFLYSNGTMTDLGTLPGGYNSQGNGINNRGQVTGTSNLVGPGGTHQYAFLYSNGTMIDLGTLGGFSSYGWAINDNGQVTGFSDVVSPGGGVTHQHAFLYSQGVMADLGTLGGSYSYGHSINNSGQVTGIADTSSVTLNIHAFLYSDGVMRDLNDLIDPALKITLVDGRGINDLGQIVVNDHLPTELGQGHGYLLTPVPEPASWVLCGAALLGLMVRRYRRP